MAALDSSQHGVWVLRVNISKEPGLEVAAVISSMRFKRKETRLLPLDRKIA